MDDLGLHIALFLLSAMVIVAVTCMYTEAEDGKAIRKAAEPLITVRLSAPAIEILPPQTL